MPKCPSGFMWYNLNTIYQEKVDFCQHETYFVDKTMICEAGVWREIKGNEEQGNWNES